MAKLSNRKNVKKFTDNLVELMINQNFSLVSGLELMKEMKHDGKRVSVISKTAKEIIEYLQNGNSFGKALEMCSFIDFDNSYTGFIRFAEKTGNLEESISFLREKCQRQDENISKLKEAIVYPLFVIVVSIVALALLFLYAKTIGTMNAIGLSNESFYSGIKEAFSFLMIFCFGGWYFVRKNLKDDKLYEAFLAAGFLVKNGESFSNAITIAGEILGSDSREGKWFKDAGEKLEYGFDLKSAFGNCYACWGAKKIAEVQEAFFYAEKAGARNEVFEKIADKLKLDSERRRNICLKLIEPLCIAGTGGFLFIFLLNTILPLLSGNLFEGL